MRCHFRRAGTIVAVVVSSLILPGGPAIIGNSLSARAADPPPRDAAFAGKLFTLVYSVASNPEGEVAQVGGDTFRVKYAFTAVKGFRLQTDGTFAFEGCDFGFCHGEDTWTHAGKETKGVYNCQPLVRATGKIHAPSGTAAESLTLRLEWAPGAGTLVSVLPNNQQQVVKTTISPDGKTQTSTWQEPGKEKSSSASKQIEYNISEWTWKPAAARPRTDDGSNRVLRSPGPPSPESTLPLIDKPTNAPLMDKAREAFQGRRTTTLNECFKKTKANEFVKIIGPQSDEYAAELQQRFATDLVQLTKSIPDADMQEVQKINDQIIKAIQNAQ